MIPSSRWRRCSASRSIPCGSTRAKACCRARGDGGNRRVFDEESVNWMQGIQCLKGCGASIEDIQTYRHLCLLEESEENLRARYAIILKQREEAYRRLEEAKATVKHMEDKAAHYEAILAGLSPDDTNPQNWTVESRPRH